MVKTLFKYSYIGLIVTVIHVVIASLLNYFWNQNILIANWIAFFIALSLSYVLNSMFVFQVQLEGRFLFKFLIVSFITFISITSISLIATKYKFNFYLTILIISSLMPFVNFLFHKFWTFRMDDNDAS